MIYEGWDFKDEVKYVAGGEDLAQKSARINDLLTSDLDPDEPHRMAWNAHLMSALREAGVWPPNP